MPPDAVVGSSLARLEAWVGGGSAHGTAARKGEQGAKGRSRQWRSAVTVHQADLHAPGSRESLGVACLLGFCAGLERCAYGKIAARFSGGNSKTVSVRGYILAKLGRDKEARDALATLESVSRERFIPPCAMSLIHAGLRDRDTALDWLQRAYEVRDVHLIVVNIDPKWDAFRSDPRHRAVMTRCGFQRDVEKFEQK